MPRLCQLCIGGFSLFFTTVLSFRRLLQLGGIFAESHTQILMDANFPYQEAQHTQIRHKRFKIHTKHTLTLDPVLYTNKPDSFEGSNTLFQTRKKSSFFLLTFGNKIITNNKHLKPINFVSNTAKPNFKYRISKFVWGIMKFLNLHKHVNAQ